nr:PREDICTED: protein SGT1 homolog ecdysoneless [Megachile rotundata]
MSKPKEDDILECFLYPKICYTKPPETVTEEMLLQEIEKFNEAIAPYVKDYIWHSSELIFRPRTKQALLLEKLVEGSVSLEEFNILPHIYVCLHFDEDISDEWFTVFLIFKLTQTFGGLIAKVTDSDGEFLLIEAANVLPPWANPETCDNHVFISNGELHIVREKHKTLFNLLNNIQEKPYLSKASEKVQDVLRKRINIYPDEIKKRHHKARVFLPEKAVLILRQEPRFVALAIRRICHSDPFERKVCRAMKYFPPEQRVMVNVKMTKCLYAMASHCRYTGDPRTGWNLPPVTSPKYNAHTLGIKIACGLEMLVARANEERRKREKRVVNDPEKLKVNEHALNTYLTRLESSGYFRNLLKDSQEYKKFQNAAKEYYLEHLCNDVVNVNNKSDAEKVLEAWENIQSVDIELHAQDESTLSPADSDSWLNIDPVQFESFLSEQWTNDRNKRYEQESLSLREKVQTFLNRSSDIDGVQFLEDRSMDTDVIHDPEDNGKIEFDADIFDSTLRGILDLVVPENEGEFEGSSEGSLGQDDEDKRGEMDKYMRLLDLELQSEIQKDESFETNKNSDTIEDNLFQSIKEEAGGSGPTGNIVGGPAQRFMHLQLQSPTTVPPDLQS